MSFSFPQVVRQQTYSNMFLTWFSRGVIVLGCVSIGVGGVLAYFSSNTSSTSTTEEHVIQACPPQEKQASPSGMLVYVSGAVKKPGVYTLNTNTNRVHEAITQAGGFSPQADKSYIAKTLNMVGKLKDGEHVYVPLEGENQLQSFPTASSSQPTEQPTEMAVNEYLNPNTATQQQLEELHGIGVVRAQQVLQGRPYSDMNDFRARSGLSNTVVNGIASLLIFSTD